MGLTSDSIGYYHCLITQVWYGLMIALKITSYGYLKLNMGVFFSLRKPETILMCRPSETFSIN